MVSGRGRDAQISGHRQESGALTLESTSCPSSLPSFGLPDSPTFSTFFPSFPHFKLLIPFALYPKDDQKLRGWGKTSTQLPRENPAELLKLHFNKMTAPFSEAQCKGFSMKLPLIHLSEA